MSKLAVHVAHYKAGPIGAIDAHNRRLGENHSNEMIDPERSPDNITILEPEGGNGLWPTIKEVADSSTGRVTANSVLMNEWVVYPPEDLQNPLTADREQLRAWAGDVVDWMAGAGLHPKQAIIHLDETTAHMHVDGVPLTADGRLSRKELYTRSNLSKWHTELAEYLASRGWDVQRGEKRQPGKKGKSKTVREYKAWAEEEKGRLEQDLQATQAQVDQAAAQSRKLAAHVEGQLRAYEHNQSVLQAQEADIQAAEDWIASNPDLAQEIARVQELQLLRQAAIENEKREKQIQALLKQREAAIACIREDLQRHINDYTALKEKKKEAWQQRSEAEATVSLLESCLEDAGLIRGIIIRVELCGAKSEAERARKRHDALCAAVRAGKHKIQAEQRALKRESDELDQLLEAGVKAAMQPAREPARERGPER